MSKSSKQPQKHSVGVFIYITRRDGAKVERMPVHSHEQAWVTAMQWIDDPEVILVQAKIE